MGTWVRSSLELPGPPRRPGRGRHLPAQPVPAPRLCLRRGSGPLGSGPPGGGAVCAPALLAGLPPAGDGRLPGHRHRRLPPPGRRLAGRPGGGRRLEGKAARATRSSTPACASWPGRGGCTNGPGSSWPWPPSHQGPVPGLADRGRPLPRPALRRGHSEQLGNWQRVAGTGNDTRPDRVLNPLRQAARFDPDGDYVRRHVPELAGVDGAAVHEPWKLPGGRRRSLDYPEPIVDHAEAATLRRSRRPASISPTVASTRRGPAPAVDAKLCIVPRLVCKGTSNR
ncbi:MAG: FAD-binding domain-containing protein [Acidimicrobiales bacterium]